MVELELWHDFFVATAGAAGALAGLLIVAVSANIRAILAIRSMPSRAACAVAGLVLVLIVACAGLIPAQPVWLLTAEVLVAGAVAFVIAVRSSYDIMLERSTYGLTASLIKVALGIVPVAVIIAGGVLLPVSLSVGFGVIAIGALMSFGASLTTGWVLLVEILR